MSKPAEMFHPSSFIREEMEARGWTIHDMARRAGVHLSTMEEIVSGFLGMGRPQAMMLGAAFGTGAQLWLDLQNAYDNRETHHQRLAEFIVNWMEQTCRIVVGLTVPPGVARMEALVPSMDAMDAASHPESESVSKRVVAAMRWAIDQIEMAEKSGEPSPSPLPEGEDA